MFPEQENLYLVYSLGYNTCTNILALLLYVYKLSKKEQIYLTFLKEF